MRNLLLLFSFIFLSFPIFSQVTSVQYMIEVNDDGNYDCKLIIANGSAVDFIDRIQFNSQFSVVLPTGTTWSFVESVNPLLDNETQTGTVPVDWVLGNSDISPVEAPDYDYYAFSPDLTNTSSYNTLNTGNVVTLFTISVDTDCNLDVRPFDNELDPANINGNAYTQGFTIGGTNQTYVGNELPSSFDADLDITLDDQEICFGECATLTPVINCMPIGTTYSWETGETTESITVCPDQTEVYFIIYELPNGFAGEIEAVVNVVDNPINTGGFEELCEGMEVQFEPATDGWSSSDVNVATVDFGVVNAVGPGIAVLFYEDPMGGCSGAIDVLVTAYPVIENVGSDEICVGGLTQLIPSGGTWVSANPSVATIEQSGLVYGVGEGAAIFYYTTENGVCQDVESDVVIVNEGPDVEILGSDNICVGETTTLSPESGGTWVSNNVAVATVTNSGIVTGVSNGTVSFVWTDNAMGCVSEPTENVTVGVGGEVEIVGVDYFCEGMDFTLTAFVEGGIEYTWTGPNGAFYQGAEIEILNASWEHSGDYIVEVLSESNCQSFGVWFVDYNGDFCDYDFIGQSCEEAEVICDMDMIDGIFALMPTQDSPGVQPFPLCFSGGAPNNISWIGFVAPEGNYEIIVTPSGCIPGANGISGIQVGIYTSCDFVESVFCDPDCNTSPTTIPSEVLIPGEEYYLFIDGCLGSVCSYEINLFGDYTNYCEDPCEGLPTTISGTAFIDSNNNGNFDSNEEPLRNVMVSIAPGDFSILTDDDGNYSIPTEFGVYTLTAQVNEGEWEDDELSIENILIEEPCNEDYNFGFVPIEVPMEMVSLSMVNTIARCDWETRFTITVENTGDKAFEGVLTFTFDEVTTFFSSEIPDYQLSGNTVTANIGPLVPFAPKSYTIKLKMPAGSSNLPTMDFSAEVFDMSGESIAEYGYEEELRCSYDPNDKREFPDREGDENLTLMDEILEYTIRFQNNGNDTAFQVTIVDPLDPSIDPRSIRVVNASHAVETCIEGTDLIFLFKDIYLVDSMTNYDASQGFVTFKCNTKEGLAEMTPVHNYADIIFDTNSPIVTNQTINTMVSQLCTDKDTLIEMKICSGDVFDGHTEAGTYTSFEELPFGCDSVITLVLEVQEVVYSMEQLYSCSGSTISIGGEEYLVENDVTIQDTLYTDGCISDINIYEVDAISDILGNPSEVVICIGSSLALDAGTEGTWASNDESIIIFDEEGDIEIVGEGSTTLVFTDDAFGCSDELPISVLPVPEIILPGSNQFCINDSSSLGATINGIWSSASPEVVEIDENGTFVGLSPGISMISLTDAESGCASFISIEILPETDPMCIVSINEIDESEVNLYPNPAREVIHFNSSIDWDIVQIFNTDGRLMSSLYDISNGKHSVDISMFSSGIYVLLFSEGDKMLTKKFVVE